MHNSKPWTLLSIINVLQALTIALELMRKTEKWLEFLYECSWKSDVHYVVYSTKRLLDGFGIIGCYQNNPGLVIDTLLSQPWKFNFFYHSSAKWKFHIGRKFHNWLSIKILIMVYIYIYKKNLIMEDTIDLREKW